MAQDIRFSFKLRREGDGEVIGGEGQGEVIGGEGQGEVIGGEGIIGEQTSRILLWLAGAVIVVGVVAEVAGRSIGSMSTVGWFSLSAAISLFVLAARAR